MYFCGKASAMKKYLAILLFSHSLFVTAQSPMRPADGGGEAPMEFHDELSTEERAIIWKNIHDNESYLKTNGKWPENFGTKMSALALEFPLAWNTGFSDYGFYGISNYVDHNNAYPNVLTDYFCGNRTYDTDAGYNHQGIDYFLWPFTWDMMLDGAVQIVAAAPGMIVGRYDGNFDQNCAFNPGSWNAVYVRHDDGSLAWYGHMKNGSVTPKALGETVEAGEYLGLVGSSGNSTGPHLHFELYDADNNLIDPYNGACNSWNAESWWATQPDYIEPRINRIMTHDVPPIFNPCPEPETINAVNVFSPGQLCYFAFYAADLGETDLVHLSITDPFGEALYDWEWYQPFPYYSASFWYWWYTLPDGPEGIWTWEAELAGETYTHSFQLGNAINIEDPAQAAADLQAWHSGNTLTMAFNTPEAGTYTVYVCSTTGALVESFRAVCNAGNNQYALPTTSWASGMYLIQAIPESQEMAKPLIAKALVAK